jgi:hypothetical protein
VIGASFTLRNVLAFGSILGSLDLPYLRNAIVLFNLNTFFDALPNQSGYFWVIAAGLLSAFIRVALNRRPSMVAIMIVLWLVTGLLIFAATPFSIVDLSEWRGSGYYVQWRFAAAALILAISVLVLGITEVALAILYRWRPLFVPMRPIWFVERICYFRSGTVFVAATFVGIAAVPVFFGQHGFSGLPGYETVHQVPTQIYRWVQAQPSDLRIYSAGLRPLGLVGPNFERPLFYDLNSSELDMKTGPSRLRQIREEFHPDLIIIAVHEFDSRPNPPIPLADWLSHQSCVAEVFRDAVAVAYRIDRNCTTPWIVEGGDRGRLRMGG